ncbi:MAG: sulfurtransferase TusA family protein [Nitrospiraceae bacterium]
MATKAILGFFWPEITAPLTCPRPLILLRSLRQLEEVRSHMTVTAGNAGGSSDIQVDAELDLRGVICPYNFVKTKLKLETMEAGQVLAVILDEGEPIQNVPRSVSDDGHTVLSQELLSQSYRVVIRKRAGE